MTGFDRRIGWVLVVVGLWCGCAIAQNGDEDRAAQRARRRNDVVEVVEQVRDSVVNISSTETVLMRRPSTFGMFLDEIFEYPKTTSGSGFVIHKGGYIVTNNHVVARATEHKVKFADGREYEADIVVTDPRHDLAVMKIQPDHPLKPLRLGRSDDLMIGEDAIAIGNPFGLENTVTRGVISATNRTLEFSDEVVYRDLIQTDASINPGNSGGPLLNALGELIGINTAIRPDANNVGFAIPVDQLRALLPEMLDVTHLKQIQLGMRVEGDTPRVVAVDNGSPADKAGIRLNDVLQSVDGEPIRRDVDYYIEMLGHDVNDLVPMTLTRGNQTKSVEVRLTPTPKLDASELAWQKLGVRLEPLSRAVAQRFNLRGDAGLVVTEVDPTGPARQAGMREQSDLLYLIGPYRAWPLDVVGTILQEAGHGEPINVSYIRFYRNHAPEQFDRRVYVR